MSALRPTWVEIDLGAIRHNVRRVRALIGPDCKLFAVVKGDGYGVGTLEAARASLAAGADAIAVGDPDEIPLLRNGGVRAPILLYGSTTVSQAAAVADLGVIVTVHSAESLAGFAGLGRQIEVFVKVDCGLGRLGFPPAEWQAGFAALRQAPALRLRGVYTHLRNPDDRSGTDHQAALFANACGAAEAAGFHGFERMAASSRVVLSRGDLNLTAVNPGRMLYGLVDDPQRWGLRPAIASLKSRIIEIKVLPSGALPYWSDEPLARTVRAAVVPLGYLDGLPGQPPAHVALVRGQRAPVLGRRGVEHGVLDVSAIPTATAGDEAVFLGRQNGEEIRAEDLAAGVGVPVLELLPRIGRLARRRYVQPIEASPDRTGQHGRL